MGIRSNDVRVGFLRKLCDATGVLSWVGSQSKPLPDPSDVFIVASYKVYKLPILPPTLPPPATVPLPASLSLSSYKKGAEPREPDSIPRYPVYTCFHRMTMIGQK